MATIKNEILSVTSMATMRDLDKFIKIYNANKGRGPEEARKAVFLEYDGLLSEDEYNRLMQLSKSITREGVFPDMQLWQEAKMQFRELGNNKISQAKEDLEALREKKTRLASLKSGRNKTSVYRAEEELKQAESRVKISKGFKIALAILVGAIGAVVAPMLLGMVGVSSVTALALGSLVGVSFGSLGGYTLGEQIENGSLKKLNDKRQVIDENEKEIKELEDEIGKCEERIKCLEDQYETDIMNTVQNEEDLDKDFKPEPIQEDEQDEKDDPKKEKDDPEQEKEDPKKEKDNKKRREQEQQDKNVIRTFEDVTKFVDEAFDNKNIAPLTDEELDEIIGMSKGGKKQKKEPPKVVEMMVAGTKDTRPKQDKIHTEEIKKQPENDVQVGSKKQSWVGKISKTELDNVDKEVNKKKYELEDDFKKLEQEKAIQEEINKIKGQCVNATLIGATVNLGTGRESNNGQQILKRITETYSGLENITSVEEANKVLNQLKSDVSALKVCAMRNEKEQEAKKEKLSSSAKEREQKYGKTVEDYRNHRKKVSGDGFVNLNEVTQETINITDDNYLKAAGELDKLMEADAMLTEIKGKGGLSKSMQSNNDISRTISDNVRVLANSVANYETETEINDNLRLEELLKMDESSLTPTQKELLKNIGALKTKSAESEIE